DGDADTDVEAAVDEQGDLVDGVVECAGAAEEVVALAVGTVEADANAGAPVLFQPLDARGVEQAAVGQDRNPVSEVVRVVEDLVDLLVEERFTAGDGDVAVLAVVGRLQD